MASPSDIKTKKLKDSKLRHIPKSDEHRLIIPFVQDHFEIREFPEELLEKRLQREKLERMLKELDLMIEQKNVEIRKKWKIFVGMIVLLLAILVSFMVVVLAYGGQETDSGSVEAGKKGVVSVFIIITLVIGFGWLMVGAKRARDDLRIVRALEEINRRRGVKKYNLILKFGDNMHWLELYYDFKTYKAQQDKIKRERELILHGKVIKEGPSHTIHNTDDEKSAKRRDFSIRLDESVEKEPKIYKTTSVAGRNPFKNESFNKLFELGDSTLDNSYLDQDKLPGMNLQPFILKKQQSELEECRTDITQSQVVLNRSQKAFNQPRKELDSSNMESNQSAIPLKQPPLAINQLHLRLDYSPLELNQSHTVPDQSHEVPDQSHEVLDQSHEVLDQSQVAFNKYHVGLN